MKCKSDDELNFNVKLVPSGHVFSTLEFDCEESASAGLLVRASAAAVARVSISAFNRVIASSAPSGREMQREQSSSATCVGASESAGFTRISVPKPAARSAQTISDSMRTVGIPLPAHNFTQRFWKYFSYVL